MNGLVSQWADYFPDFMQGFAITVELTMLALLVGLPFGTALAWLSNATHRWLRAAAVTVVEFGRGTPGLIVLYIAYFGLPSIHVSLSAFTAAVAALGFSTGAYTSEIIRAGIRSIDVGQSEAAAALGLSPVKQMALVILPQAFRKVIPPLIGFAILLYQGTSLAFKITVPELTSRAYDVASITYQWTSALVLAGIIYAVPALLVTLFTAHLQGRSR